MVVRRQIHWFIMWLSRVSSHGSGVCGIPASVSLVKVTQEYILSWYDLRCCWDVKLQKLSISWIAHLWWLAIFWVITWPGMAFSDRRPCFHVSIVCKCVWTFLLLYSCLMHTRERAAQVAELWQWWHHYYSLVVRWGLKRCFTVVWQGRGGGYRLVTGHTHGDFIAIGHQAAGTAIPLSQNDYLDTEPTSPCHLLIMLSTRLGSDKYNF